MKKIVLVVLVAFLFISCANKIDTNINSTNEIKIDKSSKNIVYIDYINQTNEDIRVYSKLKRELKSLGFDVTEDIKEADYQIILDLIFANKIDKKSTTKNILSNVNLGISIGTRVLDNVGISGSIGTKVGSILGDSLDSESFQIIIDLSIQEFVDDEKIEFEESSSQIISEAVYNDKPKQMIIDSLEDEIAKKVAGFFE